MLLSSRLRELRKKAKMTQQQLGDLVNVTKVSICCYENGTRTPALETIKDIANAFNVNIDYLLGNDMYLVADQSEDYGVKLSKEELEVVLELRKYPELHDKVVTDPKRIVKLISNKLR